MIYDQNTNLNSAAVIPNTNIQTSPVPGTPLPPANFALTDTITGQSSTVTGTPYSGPVSGLQYQCINLSPDNLNIAANVPNAFIHSGSGNDAIQAQAGTNVLDGGTGSNFLTGGTGTDTFFVDNRGPSADVWSTVVGFRAGDAATIWGVTPQNFTLTWADNQGAAGYTDLTVHATGAGQPTASLTLAGFSQNDLNSSRLSVSFGNISGNSYMYVHANS